MNTHHGSLHGEITPNPMSGDALGGMSARHDPGAAGLDRCSARPRLPTASPGGRGRALATSLALACSLTLAMPQAHAADKLMWLSSTTAGTAIKTTHLNGDNPVAIWPGLTFHSDLALDAGSGMVFWGDNSTLPGRLMSAAKNGTGAATVVATTVPGGRIHDLAIDPAGTGTAYWIDSISTQVYRATLPNGAPTLIPSTAGNLRDIALDLRPGKMHLYVYNGALLYRSDLPNGANEVIVTDSLGDGNPGQIALDTCADRVYAIGTTFHPTNPPEPFIRRADLSYGLSPSLTNITDVLTGNTDVGSQPFFLSLALDLHAHTMYWTSYTPAAQPQVHRASLSGGAKLIIAPGKGPTGQVYSGLVLDVADDSCASETNWHDMGGANLGLNGWPTLEGLGTLEAGNPSAVVLSDARANAPTGLFLGLASTPLPFKGGTLKPFPFFDPIILATDATGSLSIPFAMPAGVPASTELWVQFVTLDAGSAYGMSLSNALLGVTP